MGDPKVAMNVEAVEASVNDRLSGHTVTEQINEEVDRVVREQVRPYVAQYIMRHIKGSIDRGFLDKVVRAKLDVIIQTALDDLSMEMVAALELPMREHLAKYINAEWPKRVDALAGKALIEALAKVRAEFKP
jgi:citrate lyase gamma subunit